MKYKVCQEYLFNKMHFSFNNNNNKLCARMIFYSLVGIASNATTIAAERGRGWRRDGFDSIGKTIGRVERVPKTT